MTAITESTTKVLIESIVLNEMQSLCLTCRNHDFCTYRLHSKKEIIQCELYDLADEVTAAKKGLCQNCEHADKCKLPGRITGVWHCDQYS